MNFQASVIIVSYNNWANTTGPCLASILADPQHHELEIIVVDNASHDETPRELARMATATQNIVPIFNQTNRGFSGGNNDGVAMAHSDIVILLNSDTTVPPGALNNLSRLLRNHDDWDMIGPVSNAAGTEQQIFIQERSPDAIIQEGATWCAHSQNAHFLSERLDFFCVAIRKHVYQELGGLDERFGLGYYEDTAFSFKATRADKQMIMTEDIFVFHQGGKSFSSLKREKIRAVMRENRKTLLQNYGHDIKLHHMRDRNLYILKEYSIRMAMASAEEKLRLDFKFANRITLARTMYPTNPLKKIAYWYSLRSVCHLYQAAAKHLLAP